MGFRLPAKIFHITWFLNTHACSLSPWQLNAVTCVRDMGASLSTRAEWTSAAGGTGSSGKLEFSKQNESLLIDLARYVQHLVSGHQREADVVFKRPFQWKSRLSASDFQQLTSGEDYNLV